MGEANLKTEITPNATVRFNIWLLVSRISESLESSFILADKTSKWIVNAPGEGRQQVRLEIIRRLIAEKQLNTGYSADLIDMANGVENWVGLNKLGELNITEQRYKL